MTYQNFWYVFKGFCFCCFQNYLHNNFYMTHWLLYAQVSVCEALWYRKKQFSFIKRYMYQCLFKQKSEKYAVHGLGIILSLFSTRYFNLIIQFWQTENILRRPTV